jgi:hypothetical protein
MTANESAAHASRQIRTLPKILIAAACLLAFGLVFVFRKFRIDSATQRRQDLRNTHDEVIAALTAARDGSETLNCFLINASHVMDARVSP